MKRNRRNYYRILQVQPDAPPEVIKSSYRTLMRQLKQHPDFGGDTWDSAVINEAKEVLTNPDKRSKYDQELFNKQSKTDLSGRNISHADKTEQTTLTKQRRRVVRRFEGQGSVNISTKWPSSKIYGGKIRNLSTHGMQIVTDHKLSTDQIIIIDNSQLHGTARVVCCKQMQNDTLSFNEYLVGVEFKNIQFAKQKGNFVSVCA